MKILFVSNIISLYSGGHTRNILFLAEEIKKLGHDVSFFVYYKADNVHIDIPIYQSKLKKYSISKFSKEVSKFIQNQDFDIIHSNGAMNYYYFKKINKIPTVFHSRSHNFYNFIANFLNKYTHLTGNYRITFGSLLEYFYDLKYIRRKSYIIANCLDVKSKIMSDLFQNLKLISISRNGIVMPQNILLKQKKENRLNMGYLASFYPLKGWDYLLSIIKETIKRNANIIFHIAGDGILFDYVKQKSIKLKIINNIIFYGRLKCEEDRITFFSNIDYFIVPSHCPTTVTEALSFQKPIIHFGRWFDCADGMDLLPFIKAKWAVSYKNLKPIEAAKKIINIDQINFSKDTYQLNQILEENYLWNKIAKETEEFYIRVIKDHQS